MDVEVHGVTLTPLRQVRQGKSVSPACFPLKKRAGTLVQEGSSVGTNGKVRSSPEFPLSWFVVLWMAFLSTCTPGTGFGPLGFQRMKRTTR